MFREVYDIGLGRTSPQPPLGLGGYRILGLRVTSSSKYIPLNCIQDPAKI